MLDPSDNFADGWERLVSTPWDPVKKPVSCSQKLGFSQSVVSGPTCQWKWLTHRNKSQTTLLDPSDDLSDGWESLVSTPWDRVKKPVSCSQKLRLSQRVVSGRRSQWKWPTHHNKSQTTLLDPSDSFVDGWERLVSTPWCQVKKPVSCSQKLGFSESMVSGPTCQ